MDITFKSRHTSVPERFRRHAVAKLAKLEKLDHKAMRIDVEVSRERNPRQSDRSERVELTVRSRGPAIRAEAAADDRYAALDLAFAKLEARLRRAAERRKARRTDLTIRSADVLAAVAAAPGAPDSASLLPDAEAEAAVSQPGRGRAGGRSAGRPNGRGRGARPESLVSLPDEAQPGGGPRAGVDAGGGARVGVADADDLMGEPDVDDAQVDPSGMVPIQMEGDGPLVVREKFHASHPMTIDQALLEMELVGHDFYAFHDKECGRFSVVYRRRGYDYGVIRLVEAEH
jgi:ribosomal subunit interface protein